METLLPGLLLFGLSLGSMVVTGRWLGRKPIQPLWVVIGTMLGLAAPTLILGAISATLAAFQTAY